MSQGNPNLIRHTSFKAGDPRTLKIARLGKEASPWNRVPYNHNAIRTLRLQMLRDIAAGKKPRRIR